MPRGKSTNENCPGGKKTSSNQNERIGKQFSFRQAGNGTALRPKNSSKGAKEDEWEPPSRVAKSDDLVWNLPGFDKHGFYAAAHYLRRPEKNQGFRRKIRSNARVSLSTKRALATGQLEADMLDYLALLFARAKSMDTPAKHVTATALKIVVTGFEIWIAKNDGPKKEDEYFRANLEDWFNAKDYSSWEEDRASMVDEIKYFWRDRHTYYASNIVSLWKEICQGPQLKNEEGSASASKNDKKCKGLDKIAGADKSFEVLYRIYDNELADLDQFKADWDEVKALCEVKDIQQQLKVADETVLPPDIERQSYATSRLEGPNSHLELVRTFCKLLKYIRLMSTVPKAMQSFKRFRQEIIKGKRVKLRFVDPITPQDLDPEDCKNIAARMERWIEVSTNPDFSSDMQTSADALHKRQKFHRYFHCELQMLDKFLDDENVYDYFGCSKLSCFTCWGVLQGTPFRTRDTHANLWSACAFPFAMSLKDRATSSRYQLLFALKTVQDHVIERVLRRALDPEFSFSGPASLAETEPEGELKTRRRNRASLKQREDGELVEVVSARAIRIPAAGEPVCEVVDFGTQRGLGKEPMPYVWVGTYPIRTEMKVVLDQMGTYETAIRILADKSLKRPVNQWYAALIELFHKYRYEETDKQCEWRGDLYVFRTIKTQRLYPELEDLDSIEDKEKVEVIQLCRDALQKNWSSPELGELWEYDEG